MDPQENITVAIKWFKAFNTHDLEKLLTLYHPDAKHFSPKLKIHKPETKGFIVGNSALRDWWQDAFNRLPTLNYSVSSLTANEKAVFVEYLRKVDTEPDMLVAEILEIENGLIVASRVYHG